MKKFCMVGVSIGDEYQSFIPFYIFSILKSYPDYSVIIFSDTELCTNTRKMLKLIEDVGDFEVVDKYSFGLKENQQLLNKRSSRQAVRFLFYDERFDKYEALYFGDIDIFICKEPGGIYEQHLQHCDFLNLPYSNYIRALARVEQFSLQRKISHLVNNRFKTQLSELNRRIIVENRLTGLHFVKTKPYFEKVRPLFPYYLDIITGNQVRADLRRDEEILFDLVKNSRLGLPPISPNSTILDNRLAKSIAFCPLHGIHFGMFRDKSVPIIGRQVLQSCIFADYYRQFSEMKVTDPRLSTLIELSNQFVKKQMISFEGYYEKGEQSFYEGYFTK